jgi:hypothetical protein
MYASAITRDGFARGEREPGTLRKTGIGRKKQGLRPRDALERAAQRIAERPGDDAVTGAGCCGLVDHRLQSYRAGSPGCGWLFR